MILGSGPPCFPVGTVRVAFAFKKLAAANITWDVQEHTYVENIVQFGATAVSTFDQHDRFRASADRFAVERNILRVPVRRVPVERMPLGCAAVAKLLKNLSLPPPIDHVVRLLRWRSAIPRLGAAAGIELIALDHRDFTVAWSQVLEPGSDRFGKGRLARTAASVKPDEQRDTPNRHLLQQPVDKHRGDVVELPTRR